MDLVASCKEKLAYFRIKELKDILTQLGLSKQGKKQDLVDRILAILSDERASGMWAKKNVGKEDAAKLVDEIYRKMQVSGANDLASKGQGISDNTTTKLKGETEDTYQMEKVRCLCGSSLKADSMIKCEDHRCNVWQHIGCVIIPEKPMEGVLPVPPSIFYCEICRLIRADPFWVMVAHPLHPVKLAISSVSVDGSSPMQSVEKTFQLTRADRDLLAKPEYDVQAWCMLLNDKVSFRMQWPLHADLQINGMPVRAINRPGSQLLGANGRDDGPIITSCSRDGINKISLTGRDARVFCLGVRIVKRRTVQQILNLIPKEGDGELFQDALARVRRCVGGGAETENADSDSDLEVVADSIPVNLRCPMSGSRMKVAGRFKPCAHMGCFDLDVFVEMNQRSRKWQCPICLKNYSLESIIIDPYFNRITSKMRTCEEDVTEIEVKPDGSWRAKADSHSRGLGDLGQWHLPDGSLCISKDINVKPKPEVSKQVKQEGASEGHIGLKIGIKKNRNGLWEVSKPENQHSLSSGNRQPDGCNVVPMSSSATGSGREGEAQSVNQDGGGNFDYTTINGAEINPLTLNIDQANGYANQNPSGEPGEADVIVLSDSDDEIEIPSAPVYNNSRTDVGEVNFPVLPQEVRNPHSEEPPLGTGGSCLGLFDTNNNDFGVPFWSLPPVNQGGPGFQLFGSDALVEVHNVSLSCPTLMDGYTLTAETAMGSAALVPDSSLPHLNGDVNDGGLVDNPLAFVAEDPSLQIFLPTMPSNAAKQTDFRDQPDMSNGFRSDDWISLTLGGGGGSGVHGGEPTATNGLSSRQPLPSKEGALHSLADTASLLLGMSDDKSTKLSRERSESPFSFPRQKRSVRPRLYLSIDSESDGSMPTFLPLRKVAWECGKLNWWYKSMRKPDNLFRLTTPDSLSTGLIQIHSPSLS